MVRSLGDWNNHLEFISQASTISPTPWDYKIPLLFKQNEKHKEIYKWNVQEYFSKLWLQPLHRFLGTKNMHTSNKKREREREVRKEGIFLTFGKGLGAGHKSVKRTIFFIQRKKKLITKQSFLYFHGSSMIIFR